MKRFCLALSFAAVLPGCDVVSGFKLATAEQNLRQECFARFTNDCVSMTIDFNIMVIEQIQSKMLEQEDLWSESLDDSDAGDLWVEHIETITDKAIESFEDARPNIFARIFLGDAQPFSGRSVMALGPSDMNELAEGAIIEFIPIALKAGFEINEEARKKYGIAPATASEPEVVPEPEPAPAVAAAGNPESDTASLKLAIDRHVEAETSRDGGAEYPDARTVLLTDLNGDSYTDAAVLYSIEGQGGGNGSFQTLAAFYADNTGSGEWTYQGSTVVFGAGTGISSSLYRKISVSTLVHGPDDANCCPSVEGAQVYTWLGNQFSEPVAESAGN